MKKYISSLSLTVIPVILGSFVFAGLVEKYKIAEENTTNVIEGYKSIREKYSICRTKHNNLYLEHANYGSSYFLLGSELKKYLGNPNQFNTEEYGVWIKALTVSSNKSSETIKTLKHEVEQCYTDLYLNIEDLSIITNMYDAYEVHINYRIENLNSTYADEKVIYGGLTKAITVEQMIDLISGGINEELFLKKQDNWLQAISDFSDVQFEIGKIEEQRFMVEEKTFKEFRDGFVNYIKEMNNKSLLAIIFS